MVYSFSGVFVFKEDVKNCEKTGFREECIWGIESFYSLLWDHILVLFDMKLSKNTLL